MQARLFTCVCTAGYFVNASWRDEAGPGGLISPRCLSISSNAMRSGRKPLYFPMYACTGSVNANLKTCFARDFVMGSAPIMLESSIGAPTCSLIAASTKPVNVAAISLKKVQGIRRKRDPTDKCICYDAFLFLIFSFLKILSFLNFSFLKTAFIFEFFIFEISSCTPPYDLPKLSFCNRNVNTEYNGFRSQLGRISDGPSKPKYVATGIPKFSIPVSILWAAINLSMWRRKFGIKILARRVIILIPNFRRHVLRLIAAT